MPHRQHVHRNVQTTRTQERTDNTHTASHRQHAYRHVQTIRTQCLTDNTYTGTYRQHAHNASQTTRTLYLTDNAYTGTYRQHAHSTSKTARTLHLTDNAYTRTYRQHAHNASQTARTLYLTDNTHTVPHRQHAHNTSPLSANWHWSLVIVSVRPQIFSFFFCSSDGSASVSPANSQLSLVVLLQQASNKPNGKWWKELAFSKRVLPNRQRISKFEHFEIKIVFPRKRYIL